MLRCKLRCDQVVQDKALDETVTQERVSLSAVYSSDPESDNAQWSKYTPYASFVMTISNPHAFGKMEQGREYYVDIMPAD